MHRRLIAFVILLITLAGPRPAAAQERGAAALGDAIGGIGVTARVLMIGAHPDDEDTYLLTWLARGRHVETAYLSLTRGDGGQNLIGNELGQGLGAIRTEELLAARRIDGARQFFTRAYDFGFSKSAEETYTHWPKASILRDVVTVVRSFKPHVIIAVFSGTPRDGHGHHQVSGQLAREAYELAGDTVRFPRAVTAGEGAWTPLKLYQTARFNPEQATLGFLVGEYDPLIGRTYAEVASESRSQHKSQGFGTLERRGAVMGYVRREATRAPAPADANAETSIFDGIDTGWGRLRVLVSDARAGAALDSLRDAEAEVRRELDLFEPSGVITGLGRVQELLARICGGSGAEPCAERLSANGEGARDRGLAPDVVRSIEEQGNRVNRALFLASGALVEATADHELWAQSVPASSELAIHNRGARALSLHSIETGERDGPAGRTILFVAGDPAPRRRDSLRIAPDSTLELRVNLTPRGLTQPWWLERVQRTDIFAVPVDGLPEDSRMPGPWVRAHMTVDGAAIVATVPVIRRVGDPIRGEVRRPVAVAPAIAVAMDRRVEYAPANAPLDREVRVTLRSAADHPREAVVRLRLPSGLVAEPAADTVALPEAGAERTVTFRVHGRVAPGRHAIAAEAESGGGGGAEGGDSIFRTGFELIDYEHIRPRRLYRDATIAMQAVDVRLPPGLTVGYIAGVGDNVAPMLRQLGIPVTEIDPATMDRESLSRYRTVVVGPRAYEAHPALAANNPHLLDYARAGGTVVVQYGQYEMQRPGVLPYGVTLSRPHARVTVEETPVRLLAPGHPLLTTPNRITTSDFEGWVQERSLYMPVEAAPEWQTLLSVNDPGEAANDHSILVAPYGDGVYVYTTLAFFRQLPAGNPGAARLFVNLLGAGESIRP